MNEPGYDLLVVGRPSVDLIFSGLDQWPELGKDIDAAGLGMCAGTSFNTPAAANRLGLRVGYIAMIGDDPWSEIVRREFADERLPTDFLRTVERPLPFVSVALNYGHDRGFVTYLPERDEDDEELRSFAVDVVSNVNARHYHAYAGEEPSEPTAIARRRGMTVSLDAYDGQWWEHATPLDELLANADVVFANEEEALAMTGEADVEHALARMATICSCVVIKRGARGAIGIADGEVREAPAEAVDAVDTTGAGDCFNAGFLLGWLAGLPLEDSLVLGNICGAGAVGTFGGYRGCPREDAIRAVAAARGIVLPPSVGGAP